ncbi:hypothetical protein ACFXGT_15325 [Streptomyces sp. NPDC059352]|uniref:hypothetical protein n=1 Tax=Streptomyces sp. NPDC059352 TaxID=3346810 RepID=UPI003682865A
MNGVISPWGCNSNGEFGHGNTQARLTPFQVLWPTGVTHSTVGGDIPFAAPCTPRPVHTHSPPSGRPQRHLHGTVFG